MKRILVALLAVLALMAGATVASARGGRPWGREGAAVHAHARSGRGQSRGHRVRQAHALVLVGITTDGAIYRGSLESDTVEPFIPGGSGKSAVGLKVKRGKLYVAGGATGSITVYDLATKAQVAKFETGSGGFLNDLVVTRERRRLRDRLAAPEAVARDRRAGRGRHRHAAGPRRQRDPVRRPALQRQRHRREELAQARRGRLEQRQAVPDQARRRRWLDRLESTRSPAPRCPAATACCSTAASSWWSRATRPSCRS